MTDISEGAVIVGASRLSECLGWVRRDDPLDHEELADVAQELEASSQRGIEGSPRSVKDRFGESTCRGFEESRSHGGEDGMRSVSEERFSVRLTAGHAYVYFHTSVLLR